MKKILILLAALSLFSCKKDEPVDPVVNPPASGPSSSFGTMEDGKNYGGSYLPIYKGYKWCYTGDRDYCAEVTGRTKKIDGLTYLEFINYDPDKPSEKSYSYYHHEDGVHNSQLNTGTIKFNYFTILKENAEEDETWEVSVKTSPYSRADYVFTMYGQVGPYTVDGITYDDVIMVQMDTYSVYTPTNSSSYYAVQYTYYAKDVGLIYQSGSLYGLNVELESKNF